MNAKKHREIVRQNKIHRSLIVEGVYSKHDIIQELSEEDITISLLEKKVYLNNKTTYISFMTYILLEWYKDSELQIHTNPFGLDGIDIVISNKWEIVNKKNIFLPSEVREMDSKKKISDKLS